MFGIVFVGKNRGWKRIDVGLSPVIERQLQPSVSREKCTHFSSNEYRWTLTNRDWQTALL